MIGDILSIDWQWIAGGVGALAFAIVGWWQRRKGAAEQRMKDAEETQKRVERGRKAVQRGRADNPSPADRLRQNDGKW